MVENAVFDDDPLHPVALRVRLKNERRRLIPIEAVEAVCPLRRTLYVQRPRSVARRAGVGVVAVGTGTRRAARTTSSASAAFWRFGAPRVGAAARTAGRETVKAARTQWPLVRRSAVVAGETLFFLALMLGSLIASASVVAARAAREGFRLTRTYAPRGARVAHRSAVRAGRPLAQSARAGARRASSVRPTRPLAGREGVELLDSPLRAEVEALRMHDVQAPARARQTLPADLDLGSVRVLPAKRADQLSAPPLDD